MRLFVILLVNIIVNVYAEKLTVQCGDEFCERPSNRAVTMLRYTPDKPYKLRISSVNSEIEIFGSTNDLYYARYGRLYGFLPKNHIREQTRGVFPHTVEVDLGTIKVNTAVQQNNFVFEFLKSSQSLVQEDSSSIPAGNDTGVITEKPALENNTEEVPIIVNPTLAEPVVTKAPEETKLELPEAIASGKDNDSGIEEDDDEKNIGNEAPKISEQPEMIAIPPAKSSEPIQNVPSTTELPKPLDSSDKVLAEPTKASNNEEIPIVKKETEVVQNETITEQVTTNEITDEKVKTNEKVPEQVTMSENISEQATTNEKVPVQVTTTEKLPEQVTANEKVPEFLPVKAETADEPVNLLLPQNASEKIEVDVQKVTETISEPIAHPSETPVSITENPRIVSEPVLEVTTPSVLPVPENVEEIESELENLERTPTIVEDPDKKIIPEAMKENSTDTIEPNDKPPVPEKIQEIPLVETTTTELPHIEIPPPAIEIPIMSDAHEINTEAPPEVQQEQTTMNTPVKQEEPVGLPLQPKHIPKFNPQEDLLKTMEKAVIPDHLHRDRRDHQHHEHNDHQHHEHNNDHHHEHNDHQHHEHNNDQHHEHNDHQHHEHNDQHSSKPIVEKVIDTDIAEEPEPGFFGGLFKKLNFFSDKDDSEQHFHDHHAKEANILSSHKTESTVDTEFCEKIDSEKCPTSMKTKREITYDKIENLKPGNDYLNIMLAEAIDMMDFIISMGLTAVTVLIFTLGYYCISKARREGPLIAKVNELERHLMAASKENAILKGDIMDTKQKLTRIEDNSFGSNDMVIALKRDLESSENLKFELLDKIATLEKELETAAEDGLELNRMVSELLNSQTGSDSIISSVEDLQRQLNEQEETIATMNEALATKSRENSELQIQLSESGKFQNEFTDLQRQLLEITLERSNLQAELENLKSESDVQVNQLIEERNREVTRLNTELSSYACKYEETKRLLNTSEAKVQAMEECLQAVKKDGKGGEFKDLMDVAELKADLLAVTKEKTTMQEQLQTEMDSRKMLDERVKTMSEEMSCLKKNFGIGEKEKLEAQTRLEVLSAYFKEKEMQLQQELSIKEARWMKQQGETTSTVEKVQALNDEIQALKSQNDSLRAEIEAQVAAHKLNISTLEGQSHAAWLNARQAERKLEESRMESAALRRRLTSIAENPSGASDLINMLPAVLNDTMNSVPSPIRVESPNNPNSMPPVPMMMSPFMPPVVPQGFMPAGGPHFMPPPPFLPSGDMLPLGRLMSPPPKKFTPTMRDNRDRYSPRGRFSPNSRFDDYTSFETETDFSPPPSPPGPSRHGYNSPSMRSKKSKGGHSSNGSVELNPTRRK